VSFSIAILRDTVDSLQGLTLLGAGFRYAREHALGGLFRFHYGTISFFGAIPRDFLMRPPPDEVSPKQCVVRRILLTM